MRIQVAELLAEAQLFPIVHLVFFGGGGPASRACWCVSLPGNKQLAPSYLLISHLTRFIESYITQIVYSFFRHR